MIVFLKVFKVEEYWEKECVIIVALYYTDKYKTAEHM